MKRPKPKLAPRKAPDAVTLDAYVRGTTPAAAQQAPPPPPPPPPPKPAAPERVRKTVYLPPDLARRLAVRAAETGAEQSDIIAAALAKHLDA